MSYRAYAADVLPGAGFPDNVAWIDHGEGDGYVFEYESDAMFGSPTTYRGVLVFVDDVLVVGQGDGSGDVRRATEKLVEDTQVECGPVSMSCAEQYALIEATNGYVTRLQHPEYPETRVSDVARLKNMQSPEDIGSDEIRAEARAEQYRIVMADLRRNGETVKVSFDDGVSATRLPVADVDAARWLGEVLKDV